MEQDKDQRITDSFSTNELLVIKDALRYYFQKASQLKDLEFANLCLTYAHIYGTVTSEIEESEIYEEDPDPMAGSYSEKFVVNSNRENIYKSE